MKPTISVLCICFVFALSACLKKAPMTPDQADTPTSTNFKVGSTTVITPVTGKWQWVGTVSGEDGTTTPASTGTNREIDFGSDSTVNELQNGKVVLRENYTYISNFQYTATQSFDVVKLTTISYQVIMKGDTLKLNTFNIIDPSFITYVKMN
jgi:hypothetical protein